MAEPKTTIELPFSPEDVRNFGMAAAAKRASDLKLIDELLKSPESKRAMEGMFETERQTALDARPTWTIYEHPLGKTAERDAERRAFWCEIYRLACKYTDSTEDTAECADAALAEFDKRFGK
jgi:hypothetical protein